MIQFKFDGGTCTLKDGEWSLDAVENESLTRQFVDDLLDPVLPQHGTQEAHIATRLENAGFEFKFTPEKLPKDVEF